MNQCPKCHYVRQAIDEQVNADICPACGIVYKKWLAHQQENDAVENTQADIIIYDDHSKKLKDILFYVPEQNDAGMFWLRIVIFIAFTCWGFYFITAGVNWEKIGSSFLHNVNLPFHEFGHIFFAPFGKFMTILGGSLFQILMPLGLMIIFLIKQKDNFAASIMLWWCGQNFIDISPYIDDAQFRALPLVGGRGEESHDWGNLLTMMDLIEKTHKISHASFIIGACIIFIALAWSVYILYLQYKKISNK